MSDLGVATGAAEAPAERADGAKRRIRRARGLPGGRAVVGAFLVTAAAVGVFAAFLTATAEPEGAYAVASVDVEPGTRLMSLEQVQDLFHLVPMDLPGGVAGQAFDEGAAEGLVGQLVTSPITTGDLVLQSAVVDDARVAEAEKMSFSLPVTDAVGGTLEAGERIDILATYGTGADAWTAFVGRGVLLVAVDGNDGALGATEEVTLTVALSSLPDVQALGHAVRAAEVFVTRSTVAEGSTEDAPRSYRPAPDAPGPSPDPAEEQIGDGPSVEEPASEDDPEEEGDGDEDVVPTPGGAGDDAEETDETDGDE